MHYRIFELLSLLLLTGCGQYGPLYLPEAPTNKATTEANQGTSNESDPE